MATVQHDAPISGGRAAECAMAFFGIAVGLVILFISIDLLSDGMLSRALAGGAAAETSPAPGQYPRPRLAPEADSA